MLRSVGIVPDQRHGRQVGVAGFNESAAADLGGFGNATFHDAAMGVCAVGGNPYAPYTHRNRPMFGAAAFEPRNIATSFEDILPEPPQRLPEPGALPQLQRATTIPEVPAAQPEKIDQILDINLATALQLAGARPLMIQAAIASQTTAYAQLERTQVLWLPDINLGTDYQRHDGAQIRTTGEVAINSRNQFMAGAGAKAIFALTDAIYAPVAAQQVVRSRNYDVQAAKNDALLAVTDCLLFSARIAWRFGCLS